MNDSTVLLEQAAPGIYLLRINRPQALNALNSATLAAITDAAAAVAADDAARVLLLTGSGERAFVAGADIAEMQDLDPAGAADFSRAGLRALQALETLPVPVVALVNGYALGGGCELALACDWIIASERAVFGQPEVNLGIPPGFGGTQRLLRRVGRARAMELVTTGRQIPAAEALTLSLVAQVVAPEALLDAGLALARTLAAKGPLAVRLAKQAVRCGADLDLANACAYETAQFAQAFASADQKEGMRAFLEKRPPRFSGR
ncbi:MAG: enoyl-CoA hydratase/isomerase family protein [Betaproteobacteria bacterium]|nr:enoyl-CoA hydratase/isomerase family protein [Betaproteobacteria bacterium]